jgi:polyisoprenoid-binding protein YceI
MKRTMGRFSILLPGFLPSLAFATLEPLLIDRTQSHVEIAVKATVGSFVGKLANYTAIIAADPETRTIEQVSFEFRLDDVKTGNIKRDQDMLEWEHAAEFPNGRFTLSRLETNGLGQSRARGLFLFHGQSRVIAFPIALRQEGDCYAIDGEARLDTREFGLPILRSYWLLTVDPIVHVRFHLEGRLGGQRP